MIHNNTLYTYSNRGFASIPLRRNGNWTELEPGVPVSGAACVSAGINGHQEEEALYVIGGTGSSENNTGLQRYSFQSNKWVSLTPVTQVTKNRTKHGAVYLKSTSSILIYAGSQKETTTPSSDTFVIDTAAPYTVSSFSAAKASPAISPILLPWSDNEAALVGGTKDSERLHIFHSTHPTKGSWRKSRISLAHKLPDDVQCALLRRPDGSKVLESFNLETSPNTVTSTVLLGPHGKPAKPGQTLGGPSRKRATDGLSSYPTYDDQNASTKAWKDYSLAQGHNNMVVISGGGGTDSLAIFNQTSNSWLNTTRLFYGDEPKQQILGPTTTLSPTPSTPTSSSTGSGVPSKDDDSNNVGTIIGATLGSVLGVAAILIIILLFLRRVKKKREAQARDEANDKDRLSFQDQGMEPLAQSAYPMARSPVPMANSSVDSLAIFSGKARDEKSPSHLGISTNYGQKPGPPNPSPLSTIQSGGNVTPADEKAFEARDGFGGQAGDRRTDEGWSKYFEDNNSAMNLARSQSERSLSGSDFGDSGPRENEWPMKTLAPLNFGSLPGPAPLGQVAKGSPTTGRPPSFGGLVIPEGQSARISSADSISVNSEEGADRRRASQATSVDDSYFPRIAQRSWLGRPPSSAYSSVYDARPRETMTSSGRRSSVVIPEHLDEMPTHNNVNRDMSWLNLNAER